MSTHNTWYPQPGTVNSQTFCVTNLASNHIQRPFDNRFSSVSEVSTMVLHKLRYYY